MLQASTTLTAAASEQIPVKSATSVPDAGPTLLRPQRQGVQKPFFGIPDFSRVRLGDDRPDRLDVGALGGRRTLVINGFDPDRFSGSVVYAETSTERMEALDPHAPLRGLARNETTERLFREHWHPTLDLRAAPDCQTNLPPNSMARIVVYEAQRISPYLLAAEIERVAMPGAKVTITGIGPVVVVDEGFDTEFNELLNILGPLRIAGEKMVWSGYKDMPLELDDRASLMTNLLDKNQYATAQWTFSQLERFLRSYPVIDRVEQLNAMVGETSQDMPVDLNGMFARLKKAWGPSTKRRPIYWPVRVLTGFVK